MTHRNAHDIELVIKILCPFHTRFDPIPYQIQRIRNYLTALAFALRFLVSPLRLAAVAACRAASSSGKSDVSTRGSSTASLLPNRRPIDWL